MRTYSLKVFAIMITVFVLVFGVFFLSDSSTIGHPHQMTVIGPEQISSYKNLETLDVQSQVHKGVAVWTILDISKKYNNEMLIVDFYDANVEVFFKGEMIYQYYDKSKDGMVQNKIRLPDELEKYPVIIKITHPYSLKTIMHCIRYYHISKDGWFYIDKFIAGVFLFYAGLFLLFAYIMRIYKNKELLYITLMSLMMGLFDIGFSPLKFAIINSSKFWYFHYIYVATGGVFLLLYVREVLRREMPKKKHILELDTVLIAVSIVAILVIIYSDMVNLATIIESMDLLFISFALNLVFSVYIFIMAIYSTKKNDYILVFYGSLIAIITSFIDVINAYTAFMGDYFLSSWGRVILILCIILMHWDNYMKANEKINQFNKELSMKIAEKTHDIKILLDNSGQGFFSINRQLIINEEMSKECAHLFGMEIAHFSVEEVLCANDIENAEFMREIFESAFLDTQKSNVFLDLLPSEIHTNDRCLSIEYKKHSGNSEEMIIIVTDKTEVYQMNTQMLEERNRFRWAINALNNHEALNHLANDFKYCIESKFSDDQVDYSFKVTIEKMLMRLHTFKGNFAQFGFDALASIIHQMEEYLQPFLKEALPSNIEVIQKKLLEYPFQEQLVKEFEALQEITGINIQKIQESISIESAQLIELEKRVALLEGENSPLIIELRKLRFINLKKTLGLIPLYVQELSERMGKEIMPIHISGTDVLVDRNKYQCIMNELIHLFRNAIAHGIEPADERVLKGKSIAGYIGCEIKVIQSEIWVVIMDDGRGIDVNELRTRLLNKQFLSENVINEMDEHQILQYIFDEKISTADHVNEVSGRGIGLAAVKQAITNAGGSIFVESSLDIGSKFRIQLPKITDSYYIED